MSLKNIEKSEGWGGPTLEKLANNKLSPQALENFKN
jgi:hypothetical protein